MSGVNISGNEATYITVDGYLINGVDIIELSSKNYDPPLAFTIMKSMIYPALQLDYFNKLSSFDIASLFAFRCNATLMELKINELKIAGDLSIFKKNLFAACNVDSSIAFYTKLYKLLYDLGSPPITSSSLQPEIVKQISPNYYQESPIENANIILPIANRKVEVLPKKTKSSKYHGVSWNTERKCWRANIRLYGSSKYLGKFNNEDDAAKAYNAAILNLVNSPGISPYRKKTILRKLNIIEQVNIVSTAQDDNTANINSAIEDQEMFDLDLTLDETKTMPPSLAINQDCYKNYGTPSPLLFAYNSDFANDDPFGMLQPSSISSPRII